MLFRRQLITHIKKSLAICFFISVSTPLVAQHEHHRTPMQASTSSVTSTPQSAQSKKNMALPQI
ncbi:hypothetical protein, partial [Legionella oakridgensis]|uniref:hypothetical protein n=1 Tax=Legionella oakridgensis TaxID=29423 RepID=UPI001EE68EC0